MDREIVGAAFRTVNALRRPVRPGTLCAPMPDTAATATPVLRFGHSPDPDDAFMFFGLARGAVTIRDFRVEHVLHDIQTLNEMAMSGEIEITAISAHAYPAVAAP